MKQYYFGTNMKMYKTTADTRQFFLRLTEHFQNSSFPGLTLFAIPSFPSLETAGQILRGSSILLGAQNMHWEDQGQFSGEVSPLMLKDLGVSLVMLGHSERRHVFGETDEEIHKKVLSAARHKIRPLLCIGETQKEKDAGISDERLRIQLKCDLFQFPLDALNQLMIAYEPVWAIGVSGTPAPADYVKERHAVIRQCLINLFGKEGASIPILFGGSVNPKNAPEYLALPNVGGLFVGRSAWDADNYFQMVSALF